jgi:23S rRNA (cytidine1920-2'-O)/16S rRNA (cytidine1409-2'-O)-methyltransferase
MRLDRALVSRGLARSRTEAQTLIAGGFVRVEGNTTTKASYGVDDQVAITVEGSACPYVSRGGLKLAAALDEFGIEITGRLCLDVGASTGGFTDCLLQGGAGGVIAVDVGHGQMAPALAADLRVTLREGVNARDLKPADFDHAFDVIAVDLSFISLTLVLPALVRLLAPGGDVIALVKPQFEVGRSAIGKGGIVRDPVLKEAAVHAVIACAKENWLYEAGSMTSPILGGDGNEEFLLHFRAYR